MWVLVLGIQSSEEGQTKGGEDRTGGAVEGGGGKSWEWVGVKEESVGGR